MLCLKICNSNRFHRLERDEFLRVRSSESKNLTETFPEPEIVTHSKPVKSWSIIEAPGDIIQNKVTSKGIRIKVNDVPEGVASSHLFFYICVECGKCYWGKSSENFTNRILYFLFFLCRRIPFG